MKQLENFAIPLLIALIGCSTDNSADRGGAAPADDAGATFSSLPNPAILIANGGSSSLMVVDPSTMTVASSLTVRDGLHPHHVGLAPDGSRVLITATSADLSAGHGGGAHGAGHEAAASTAVYELDVGSRVLREVITIDATAHNAAFTQDGAFIALSMSEHGMLAVHDATTFEEAFTASGFNMPLEVTPTPAGKLLIAESGAARVSLFDLDTREVESQFDVGAVPVAAWASGGSSYFVSVEEAKQVRHLIESDDKLAMDAHTIDPGGMPGQAIVTPDGSELWVAVEDTGVIAIFDVNTHDKLGEIAAGEKPHGIAFEPNGDRAFVTDEDAGKLLVIDVASRDVISEVTLGGKPNGIAWLEN